LLSGETCLHCYQGYRGRIGVFELLPVNTDLRSIILKTNNREKIIAYAEQQAWLNLQTAGQLKMMQGITTAAELKRVI
jgi:type IV pilus assembly protein PilB